MSGSATVENVVRVRAVEIQVLKGGGMAHERRSEDTNATEKDERASHTLSLVGSREHALTEVRVRTTAGDYQILRSNLIGFRAGWGCRIDVARRRDGRTRQSREGTV